LNVKAFQRQSVLDATNSEIQQLNFIGRSPAVQAMNEQRSQGAIDACLVEQCKQSIQRDSTNPTRMPSAICYWRTKRRGNAAQAIFSPG